jgi:hypothetical protein
METNPLDTPEMRKEIDELHRNMRTLPFDFDRWMNRIVFGNQTKLYGKITPDNHDTF